MERLSPARRLPQSAQGHPHLPPPRGLRIRPCRGNPRLLCRPPSTKATTLLAVARWRLPREVLPTLLLLGLKLLLASAVGPREASLGGPRLRQVSGVRNLEICLTRAELPLSVQDYAFCGKRYCSDACLLFGRLVGRRVGWCMEWMCNGLGDGRACIDLENGWGIIVLRCLFPDVLRFWRSASEGTRRRNNNTCIGIGTWRSGLFDLASMG